MVRVKLLIPFLGPFFKARSFLRNPLRFIGRRLFRFSLSLGIFGISIGLGGIRLSIRLGIFRLVFGGGRRKSSRGGRKFGRGSGKSRGGQAKSGGGEKRSGAGEKRSGSGSGGERESEVRSNGESDRSELGERVAAKMRGTSQNLRMRREESLRSERAEQEAYESVEREKREQPEREAREKVARDAREKAPRDAGEEVKRKEREARDEAARDARVARDKAARDARDKAARDAGEEVKRKEREARDEAARDAREKAARDAGEEAKRKERGAREKAALEKAARDARDEVERKEREARKKIEEKDSINRPDHGLIERVNQKEFNINGPLPFQKRVLLEASAGTGKTFSLTSLVARYVAEEDLKIDQLLMVTFTNAAANEMRERSRGKLREALVALNVGLTADAVKPDQDWIKCIVDCTGEERERRKSRLGDAITSIDSATITTIHGFFQQALREVGLRSADSANSEVNEGKDSIGKQILRDELVIMFAAGRVDLMDALPKKSPSDLENEILQIIRGLDSNISATAAPESSEDVLANSWSVFVNRIREKINEQRLASGALSFDDLITGLRDLLKPSNPLSTSVIQGMRSRYRLVLIDEFQDTDDTQWDIFSKIFDVEYIKAQQGSTRTETTFLAMVLVGDPKQAIYRFRGADIAAYLKAIEDPNLDRFEMTRNFRSDRNLITGLNRWFQGKSTESGTGNGFKFGNKNIGFIQVDPARKGAGSGLVIEGHIEESKSLQLRWIDTDRKPTPTVKVLRPRIAEDLCNHVTLLLNSGKILDKRGGAMVERPVQPGDISILVRAHSDADQIVLALRERRIPVVKSNVGSVAQSEAVDQMRNLLLAMSSPNDSRRVKALGLTWFVGYSALDILDETKIIDLGVRCNEWAKQLVDLGIVGFYQTLRSEESVLKSISRSFDAERRFTDLEHLAELIHSRSTGKKLTASSVLRYLEEIAAEDDESEEMLRRIDSDAKAIQITTMHAAKGLEYPIVLIPYPKAPITKGAEVFTYKGRRYVNAAPHSQWETGELNAATRKALTSEEIEGDDLRLMYVAFTRAKHQLVVWWANSKGMNRSPLGRLLFGDHEDITKPTSVLDGNVARKHFSEIQQQIGLDEKDGEIMHVAELSLDEDLVLPRAELESSGDLIGRSSDFPQNAVRDWRWRRWSFSSISSSLKHEESDSHRGGFDEGEVTGETVSTNRGAGDFYSGPGLFAMPASAEFGTLVHEVLEKVNFTSSTLKDDLFETIGRYGSEALRNIDTENLAQGLFDSLSSPLDPLVSGFKLTDLDARDRLAEMDFHFSLAKPEVSAERIAQVAATDKSSMFNQYFEALAQKWQSDGGYGIAGLMTGSIDALFRVAVNGHDKYFVVDYKTNRLHAAHGEVRHSDYEVEAMTKAMKQHNYPIQALFYCVALHRFLTTRVSDYDIDRDLGGAGYLFVRGMVGPETPMNNGCRNGVLSWRPSTEIILRISSLLSGGAT